MTRHKRRFAERFWNAVLLVVLLPFIVPFGLIAVILFLTHRIVLYILVWLIWLLKGKDLLVVYSDSPIWHDYMVAEILPLVEKRAIVLNWSERGKWPRWSLRAHVFRHFGSRREFNPLIVLFRPLRRAKVFRFWLPFKDWKRGYREPVERLREELLSAL